MKQFLIAAGGTIITFFIPALLKRVKSFRNMGWIYCITGITLLLAVLFCTEVFGANLVLTLGPVSVQPGEFVKILFVMFVASMFNKSTSFEQTVKVTVIAAIHVIILVISKDLGAALIFFVVYLMMLFIATRKLSYVGIGLAAGSVLQLVHIRFSISKTACPYLERSLEHNRFNRLPDMPVIICDRYGVVVWKRTCTGTSG